MLSSWLPRFIEKEDLLYKNRMENNVSEKTYFETQAKKDDNLVNLWLEIARLGDSHKEMLLKAEKLVVQGIPNVLRSLLWVKLAGISDSHLQSWYSTTLKKSSPHDSQIRRDVARTFPNHSFFSKKGEIGQETLYKVVKAYSLYDPELGYCQGIAFVVGILLLQLPEEDSFTVLTVLMQKFKMRQLYLKDMPLFSLTMFQLSSLVEEIYPDLYAHLEREGCEIQSLVAPWILTLFSNTLPFPVIFHLMDYVFVFGHKYNGTTPIMLQLSLSILGDVKNYLLTCCHDDIMHYFRNDLKCLYSCKPSEPNSLNDATIVSTSLFETMQEIKISSKQLSSLQRIYEEKKALEIKRNDKIFILTQKVSRLELKVEELLREKKALEEYIKILRGDLEKRIDILENQDIIIERLRNENARLTRTLQEIYIKEQSNKLK